MLCIYWRALNVNGVTNRFAINRPSQATVIGRYIKRTTRFFYYITRVLRPPRHCINTPSPFITWMHLATEFMLTSAIPMASYTCLWRWCDWSNSWQVLDLHGSSRPRLCRVGAGVAGRAHVWAGRLADIVFPLYTSRLAPCSRPDCNLGTVSLDSVHI